VEAQKLVLVGGENSGKVAAEFLAMFVAILPTVIAKVDVTRGVRQRVGVAQVSRI
jgi:hypothetical protein